LKDKSFKKEVPMGYIDVPVVPVVIILLFLFFILFYYPEIRYKMDRNEEREFDKKIFGS